MTGEEDGASDADDGASDDDRASGPEAAADPLAWGEGADATETDTHTDTPASGAGEDRAGVDGPAADEGVAPVGGPDGQDGPRPVRSGSDEIPDGLFEEAEVTELDADAVWDHVEADDAPDVEVERGDERVVESAEFCERCPYFSEPPTVGCTHPGTEILEVLDTERFRVVDCPKVWEAERLEQL